MEAPPPKCRGCTRNILLGTNLVHLCCMCGHIYCDGCRDGGMEDGSDSEEEWVCEKCYLRD